MTEPEGAMGSVREQLVALRKRKELTQRDLAQRLGVSQPVIADFELPDTPTSLRTAIRIAAELGARLEIKLVIDDANELPAVSRQVAARKRSILAESKQR